MIHIKSQEGFSILEVVLAAAIFVTFGVGAIVALVSSLNANRLGAEETIANQFNAEGMDAVRSIKNQAFDTFANKADTGNTGVAIVGGVWTFSGTSDTLPSDSRFIRTIAVTSVQRDASGNIVTSGGTNDVKTKKVVVTTTWNFNAARRSSVTATEYLSNWRTQRKGMLVYTGGGTLQDEIDYRVFDSQTNTWSAESSWKVDLGTGNKAMRSSRIFASAYRNEKILLTRHVADPLNQQSIYASTYDGTTWTPTQLTVWTCPGSGSKICTGLDFLNFDGGYLPNGDFIVVYSDNTNVPKFRVWNGSTWSAEQTVGTAALSGVPNWMVISIRPDTGEIMAAFLTSANTTETYYYNGSTSYAPSNWGGLTVHSTGTPSNLKRIIDFTWSPNTPTTGMLAYASASSAKRTTVRLFVANGSGGGSWGTAVDSANQSNNVGAMSMDGRPTANEFQTCEKDDAVTPNIICYKVTFSGNIPTYANTGILVSAKTDTGPQRSFDNQFEGVSGDPLIAVYSDNTSTPKFKKFNASTATWDGSPTSINMAGFSPGVFKTIRIIPQDQGDDMMVMMADANLDLYIVFYNGSTNSMYTTPASKAVSLQGTKGSATSEFWYDFAWDKF